MSSSLDLDLDPDSDLDSYLNSGLQCRLGSRPKLVIWTRMWTHTPIQGSRLKTDSDCDPESDPNFGTDQGLLRSLYMM